MAGCFGALRGGTLRAGVTAAAWNSMVEYLVWYPAVLVSYYIYFNSPALDRTLRAEGTYTYFRHSGMTNLRAFVLQDFYGAGLYHLVAGVVLATFFGTVAAALTLGIQRSISRHNEGAGAE